MDSFPLTDGVIIDGPIIRKEVIRDAVGELDIADTYPRHLNLSHDEANSYVLRVLRDKLRCMPAATKLVRLGYDQSTLSCIRQLTHINYGVGQSIESIATAEDFSSYLLRFLKPIQWN